MNEALSLHRLGLVLRPHFWSRPHTLLDDVSFAVEAGQTCALLGANGAGKTTLMRVMLGLVRATRGHGRLNGVALGDPAGRAALGFLPERPALPLDFTPLEFVSFAARQSGLCRADARAAAIRALDRLGVGAERHRRMRHFSKGMQQKVGLAQAVVHAPKLLVLDEPLSGLDPPARRDVRELLQKERLRGAAIVFSTHILADVIHTCDRAAVLSAGRLTHFDAPLSLLLAAEKQGAAVTCDVLVGNVPEATARAIVAARPATLLASYGGQSRIRISQPAAVGPLVSAVLSAGGELLGVERDVRALEALLAPAASTAP